MDVKFYEEEIKKIEANLEKLNSELFLKKKEIADYKERGSAPSYLKDSLERTENEIRKETDKLNEYSSIISDYNAKVERDNLLTEESVVKYKSEVERIDMDIRHFNAQIDYLNKNRGRMSESHYFSEVDRINSLITANEQKKDRCEKLIENYDKKLMLEQKINESKLRVEKYQKELDSVKNNLDKEVYEQTISHLNNMIKVELDGQEANRKLIEGLYDLDSNTVVKEIVSSNEVVSSEKVEEMVEEEKIEEESKEVEEVQAVNNTNNNANISGSSSSDNNSEVADNEEEIAQTVSNVSGGEGNSENNVSSEEEKEEEESKEVEKKNELSGSKIVSSKPWKWLAGHKKGVIIGAAILTSFVSVPLAVIVGVGGFLLYPKSFGSFMTKLENKFKGDSNVKHEETELKKIGNSAKIYNEKLNSYRKCIKYGMIPNGMFADLGNLQLEISNDKELSNLEKMFLLNKLSLILKRSKKEIKNMNNVISEEEELVQGNRRGR